MTSVAELVRSSPTDLPVDEKLLIETIELLYDGAATCTACADACIAENEPHCAATCLNCADICFTTARILSRATGFDADTTRAVLTACEQTCRTCAEHCERHAEQYEHCRVCAESCRRRADACHRLIDALAA
ncbi:MAG TPA: hypothetical protein VM324_05070 [Egibacteraceae bacterium]|jgi:hypothetical protein|nr:hypothetical protein [Egibacteraceae bacterium]